MLLSHFNFDNPTLFRWTLFTPKTMIMLAERGNWRAGSATTRGMIFQILTLRSTRYGCACFVTAGTWPSLAHAMPQIYLRSLRHSAVKARAVYFHVLPSPVAITSARTTASQDASFHVCKADPLVASPPFSQEFPPVDNLSIKQVTPAPPSAAPAHQHPFAKRTPSLDPGSTSPRI